jgi:Zn-dependent protease/predicted transcriptional regulator
MFGRPIPLFSLRGIPVRLDPSWFLIALLLTWSLAVGVFPAWQPDQAKVVYWAMGIVGALGLFASIIAHEFCHAVVARRHAIPMNGIILFVFGGVAEMGGEPPKPRAELAMAAAGPIASIGIGAVALGLATLGGGWWPPVVSVLSYLGAVNLVLAAFNLLPAFPLDGGRIFRAAVWRWTGDLRRATRVASRLGVAFSVLFMAIGALRFVAGDPLGGVWLVLIGLFLRQAAIAAYQQVLVRRALEGEPVRRFMTVGPITVRPDLTLSEFLNAYVYRYHHKLFPVQDNGRLVGAISPAQLRSVPREQWPQRTVGSVAVPWTPESAVTPNTAALQALVRMRQTGHSRLLVVEDGRLAGILSVRDLLDFLALKLELEP